MLFGVGGDRLTNAIMMLPSPRCPNGTDRQQRTTGNPKGEALLASRTAARGEAGAEMLKSVGAGLDRRHVDSYPRPATAGTGDRHR